MDNNSGVVSVEDGLSRRMFMRTVGVDLSVTKRRTAVVGVEWGETSATVGEPVIGPAEDVLVGLVADGDWVGISAPFGWPRGMVSSVHAYSVRGQLPVVDKAAFRYRRTDLFVHDRLLADVGRKVWPLSVSSDGIALRAWRLACLREELADRVGSRFDRSGRDGVVEVFPGAALLLWGFERGVYRRGDVRGDEGVVREAREAFLSSVEAVAPWLRWGGGSRTACLENEDVVDGLISALVARAAGVGATSAVDEQFLDDARFEGWVHLPKKGGLAGLVGSEVSAVGEV